jgi:TetR/AcrR family transcriptional repressor of lmrAB and yxaGH operons
MTSTTRETILQTTCDLLENQGYHATGLNEIVRESKTPKGSLYYYFPAGKDEIASEAVLLAGRTVSERIRENLGKVKDPAEAVQSFVETIAYYVEVSGFRSGGPLTIVAAETATTSERLNLTCREAYMMLHGAFKAKLTESGAADESAEHLAWTIIAAIEGATILSRTFHSGDPLRRAAVDLACLLRSALKNIT